MAVDFDFDPESDLIVANARRFLEKEIRPEAARFKDALVPREEMVRLLGRLRPFGFLGALIPAAEGGSGLDFLTTIRLYVELFRVFPGLGGTAFVNQVAGYCLHRDGTPEQKARYLPGLLAGELIGSQAATEPEVGSNPRAIRMRGRDDGDGFRLNGRKVWISNGSIADFCVVLVRTDDGETSRIIVERADGFTSRELPTIGLLSWSTAELDFADIRVPRTRRLGLPGSGTEQVLMDFSIARCFAASAAVGIAQAAFEQAVAYARQREQWGKPIGQHQLVQELIADMAVDLDCCRLLAYRAAEGVDKGGRDPTEAAVAKLFTSEAVVRITSNAIQVHGAMGLSREMPLEGWFRDARMMTIPDGTSQLQKLIIARRHLGLAAFGDARRS